MARLTLALDLLLTCPSVLSPPCPLDEVGVAEAAAAAALGGSVSGTGCRVGVRMLLLEGGGCWASEELIQASEGGR